MIAGITNAKLSKKSTPSLLIPSIIFPGCGGYGESFTVLSSPLGQITVVPQSGQFFSLSASSTPHFTQYIFYPFCP
jgi:hypothetical protein